MLNEKRSRQGGRLSLLPCQVRKFFRSLARSLPRPPSFHPAPSVSLWLSLSVEVSVVSADIRLASLSSRLSSFFEGMQTPAHPRHEVWDRRCFGSVDGFLAYVRKLGTERVWCWQSTCACLRACSLSGCARLQFVQSAARVLHCTGVGVGSPQIFVCVEAVGRG